MEHRGEGESGADSGERGCGVERGGKAHKGAVGAKGGMNVLELQPVRKRGKGMNWGRCGFSYAW